MREESFGGLQFYGDGLRYSTTQTTGVLDYSKSHRQASVTYGIGMQT